MRLNQLNDLIAKKFARKMIKFFKPEFDGNQRTR